MNGSPALNTIAIFPDTLIQTEKNHSAKIDTDGSTALVQPETIVQFEGDELVLDHGGLQLETSRTMRVRINCITVIPISADRTQYDVTDIDGRIRVSAYKNDVKIHYKGTASRKTKQSDSSDAIVRAGEQSVRSDRCGVAAKPTEIIAAKGAILNSVEAKAIGVAAIAAITCWALCTSTIPASPSQP